MKKLTALILNIIFTVICLISPLGTIANATSSPEAQSTKIGFLETIDNLSHLDSFHMIQSIYGGFQVNPTSYYNDKQEIIKGDYRININNQLKSEKPFESNTKSNINGKVNVSYVSNDPEGKPFDNLTFNFEAEVIGLYDDGVYAKLNHAGFNATGVPENDRLEYLEAKKQFAEVIKQFKGQWFYIPASLSDNLSNMNSDFNVISREEIIKKLQEKGVEETYKDLFQNTMQDMYKNGLVADKDLKQFNALIDIIFETKFFQSKDIKRGRNKGFTAFRLNKNAIVKLIRKIAAEFDEEISKSDLSELRYALGKIRLMGIYRMNSKYKIFDNFALRFSMRNIEELKKLSINYRYRVSKINQPVKIAAPTNFKSVEELLMPLMMMGPMGSMNNGSFEITPTDSMDDMEMFMKELEEGSGSSVDDINKILEGIE